LYKAGRKQAAIRQWNRNTQLFPDSPSPYFQRATFAADSKEWLEAARWYTKCLRKDNGYYRTGALFRRGECYLLAGNAGLAIADFAALPDDHEDYLHEGFERRTKAQMLAVAQASQRHEA
jgi:tetratricopeptide (TPR) repeat protein